MFTGSFYEREIWAGIFTLILRFDTLIHRWHGSFALTVLSLSTDEK